MLESQLFFVQRGLDALAVVLPDATKGEVFVIALGLAWYVFLGNRDK